MIEVASGGEKTLLSVVRLYRMRVLPNEVLDMIGSLHLIIGYLLEDEYERFESRCHG